jgi:hypothetical protein
MLAGAQTGLPKRTTMIHMSYRLGRGWQLWMTLMVTWTVAVTMYGWIDLPRAYQMPHDPQFLSKLSHEASSILFGTDAQAKPVVSGALVWSEVPRLVSMPNGMRLAFPGATTSKQAAFFTSEYRQLLDVEAAGQRVPYLAEMFAVWFAPLLAIGLAVNLIRRGYRLAARQRGAANCLTPGNTVGAGSLS